MAYNQPYYGYYPQYNNGAIPDALNQFKGQYQQPMQMPQQPIQQMPPTQMPVANNDFLWVLGEVEAVSFPVAPNNTVTLWDKNQPTIYIKSANAQGVPSMRILDFTERAVNAPKTPTEHVCKCGDKFATKEAFEALQGKYDEIKAIVDELKSKPSAKSNKKQEVE